MSIDKGSLLNRLASLQKGREEIMAEMAHLESGLHATSGAIQEVEFWLERVAQEKLVDSELEETKVGLTD